MEFGACDMLVLPGGMPGTANLDAHDGVRRVVREFCEKGKYVGAICAAPSILGNMGLLKGKRGTCFPAFEDRMSGAVLVKAPVVQDGNIITSRGMGTAIEFGLKLVEVLTDKAKADEIAQSIIYLK